MIRKNEHVNFSIQNVIKTMKIESLKNHCCLEETMAEVYAEAFCTELVDGKKLGVYLSEAMKKRGVH